MDPVKDWSDRWICERIIAGIIMGVIGLGFLLLPEYQRSCLCSENNICKGCRRDGFLELSWCKNAEWCEVRNCGIGKNLRGCYECEPAQCRKGLYVDKIKARTFAEFARRYGIEELLDCLERNEQTDIVYHREGIIGDYDDFNNMEELMRNDYVTYRNIFTRL